MVEAAIFVTKIFPVIPCSEKSKVPSNRRLLFYSNKNRLQHMPYLYKSTYSISYQFMKRELRFF